MGERAAPGGASAVGFASVGRLRALRTLRVGAHSGLKRKLSFGNNNTTVEPSKKRPISSPFWNAHCPGS